MHADLYLFPPAEFPAFPYKPPYDIQISLMRHLYESIEDRKVSIVESPTGTGKTLSLLCASLTWLADERNRATKGKLKEVAGMGDVRAKDWVIEQSIERARRELEADERDYEERLTQARKREKLMRLAVKARVTKKLKLQNNVAKQNLSDVEADDDQFLPETDQPSTSSKEEIHISSALKSLMEKFDSTSKRVGFYNESEKEISCTKVYYASRTHSQLAQLLPELGKLAFQTHISVSDHRVPAKRSELHEDHESLLSSSTRVVSLGSRKQLCINDELRAKSRDLDEACRELLGEKESKRCQFLPPVGEEEKLMDFRDQILASPKDIEDLAEAGQIAHTCPYFGSRHAIPRAELVILPYNLLLQKSARESLGIDLSGQVVLIDEAHNLIPTLLSLSTINVTYLTLETSFHQVCTYVSRFKTRLTVPNMLHLKRLVLFLDSLKKCAEEWKSTRLKLTEKTEVMTVAQLIERMGKRIAGINFLEIGSYLKKSKIARKISGYSDRQAERENASHQVRRGAIPPLHIVEDFMLSLTNTNADGRVTFSLISTPGKEEFVEMKYQLLNPSPQFKEVVEEARSVILAGGTMSPISDVVNQLFSYLPADKLTSFSCGHIIPETNLQTLVVTKGPNGGMLEFKADKQKDSSTIALLGQILLNFSRIVPAGLIIFFPSYKFLNAAKDVWVRNGQLEKLEAKKKVFFEPEDSAQVDSVLSRYAEAARKPSEGMKGGLLFAVIGAKMSEGLNFSDDLARAVVIVGLPFANLGSPELQERLKYVKVMEEQRGNSSRTKGQKDAAAELYENMCMNAVNQSIGRAIRHRNDWASLLLLDRRYGTSSIRNKLPQWIGSRLIVTEGFGNAMNELGSFFRNKRV